MGYWFVIMPAVAFQSLLTSKGNSIKPFITNVTTTAVCVFVCMCFLCVRVSLYVYSNCMSMLKEKTKKNYVDENVCVCVRPVCPPPILQGVSGKVQTSVEQSPGRTERTGRWRAMWREKEESRLQCQREIKRSGGKYQVCQTREKQWGREAEQKDLVCHTWGERGSKR